MEGKQYVYLWADGVHFNIRLEEDRQCILVLMGATADGHKELIAVVDGFRESEQSWKALLLDVKSRGLVVDPKLATGDGALGFWKALPQVFPTTREQRCWVHKTANVLDKLPKRLQPEAKEKLHEIWMAATTRRCRASVRLVRGNLRAKYPKATECLPKDRDVLLDVLRLPGRALDPLADDQSHREHVRHGAPAASPDQGQRLTHGLPDDGLQADAVRRQEMAAPERLKLLARRDRRSSIHRRNQTPRNRRLKNSHPQLIAIS